jgi:hypothetical protein
MKPVTITERGECILANEYHDEMIEHIEPIDDLLCAREFDMTPVSIFPTSLSGSTRNVLGK